MVRRKLFRRPKSSRAFLVVKVFVFVIIVGQLGFLVYWFHEHPIRIRIGGRKHVLSVEPEALDFGQAKRGEAVAKQVRIKNMTGKPVELHRPFFTDDCFSLKGQGEDLALAPRGTLELAVVYEPYVGGTSEGEMQLRVKGQSTPDVGVAVRGTGLLPRLEVSARWLDFGEVKTEEQARRTLTLRSVGTEPLVISNIAVRAGEFKLAQPFTPGTLKPNGSYTVEVVFTPRKLGECAGELVISSNDPNKEVTTIPLSASYRTAAKRAHERATAARLLDESKRDLRSAYAMLTYTSTNKLLMRRRRQMGQQLFERAWPKYERANAILRSINAALEDKEFFLNEEGELRRRAIDLH